MKDLIKSLLRNYVNEDVSAFTPQELKNIAQKYNNFKEFIQKEPKVLAAIRRKGKDFEMEVTGHMDRSHYKKWSDDELRMEALKYKTKTEFQDKSPNASAAAFARGKDFYNDITSHMEVKKKLKWTDEELENEAKKYQTITDFRKNSPKAAAVARQRGRDFYDKITTHLKPTFIKWTDDMLRDEAKKYKNKAEFERGSPQASQVAFKRGKEFWDDVTSHMTPLHKTWTDEKLRDEAKKYNTPGDFYKFGGSAAQLARDRGEEFWDEITSHMIKPIEWTDEMLKAEAQKYTSRSEFSKNSSSAYYAANKRGILDDITMHMEPVGNMYKRMIYVYEFPDNHFYVGLTFNLKARTRGHMKSLRSPVFQHISKTGLQPIRKSITDYMDKNEAVKKENQVLNQYIKKGWIPLNKAKTGSLGGKYLKWTDDEIRKEASKYTNYTDFQKNSRSASNAAMMRGEDFYNEITSHMKRTYEYHTNDQLRDMALKFKTKKEFADTFPSEYQKARGRGKEFFDSITKHMVPLRKKWTDENLRNEAKKYKTRKEFHNNAPSAYNAAKSKGQDYFLQITSHMRKK
jgi:predicted GIY-YIG superfamily endonuclease